MSIIVKSMELPRYIDADALMKQLNRKKAEPCNKRYTEGFNDALMRFRSMVHSAPTISPDEVRGVGKWSVGGYYDEMYGRSCVCSACGRSALGFTNYCPNCGAKMEVTSDA